MKLSKIEKMKEDQFTKVSNFMSIKTAMKTVSCFSIQKLEKRDMNHRPVICDPQADHIKLTSFKLVLVFQY